MKRYLSLILILLLVACKPSSERDIQSEIELAIVDTLEIPFGENSSLPRLFGTKEHLYLSLVTRKDTVNYLQMSRFDGEKWTPMDTIISGSDWFVNWADFPQISENNGYLLNSYLKKSASGTYTYDIRLNHFDPQSSQWKTDYLLNTDGTQSEHGFVSVRPHGENGFFVSWLDGRNTAGNHGHSEMSAGAMTLRGAFIDSTGKVSQEIELDSRVCDCCNTASSVTPNSVLVAYRDRSEEEIRDIAVVRYFEGRWEESRILGNDQWKIPGCPVNGPAMDAFQESVIVAWFTAANDNPKVQIAFSEDGGESFGLPVRTDSGNAIGRVDVAMLNKNEAVVSWMEPDGDDAVIQVRKVASDGTMGMPITVARNSAERASGFPQMELFGDRLYFAWTHSDGDTFQIMMASVSLKTL